MRVFLTGGGVTALYSPAVQGRKSHVHEDLKGKRPRAGGAGFVASRAFRRAGRTLAGERSGHEGARDQGIIDCAHVEQSRTHN